MSPKRLVLILGSALILSACTSATPPSPAPTPEASEATPEAITGARVIISNFAYSPESITVKAGETVTWVNQDSAPHSATADNESFDTGTLQKGQSKAVTFAKAGTFSYHCTVHPTMKASVTAN